MQLDNDEFIYSNYFDLEFSDKSSGYDKIQEDLIFDYDEDLKSYNSLEIIKDKEIKVDEYTIITDDNVKTIIDNYNGDSIYIFKLFSWFIKKLKQSYLKCVHSPDKKFRVKITKQQIEVFNFLKKYNIFKENSVLPEPDEFGEIYLSKAIKLNNHYLYNYYNDFKKNNKLFSEYFNYKKKLYNKKETKTVDAVSPALTYFSKENKSDEISYSDIIDSENFNNLSNLAKLILLDMIIHMNFKFKSCCKNFMKNGFTYTFEDCKIKTSHKSFYNSLNEIVEFGYFNRTKIINSEDKKQFYFYKPSEIFLFKSDDNAKNEQFN